MLSIRFALKNAIAPSAIPPCCHIFLHLLPFSPSFPPSANPKIHGMCSYQTTFIAPKVVSWQQFSSNKIWSSSWAFSKGLNSLHKPPIINLRHELKEREREREREREGDDYYYFIIIFLEMFRRGLMVQYGLGLTKGLYWKLNDWIEFWPKLECNL